MMSKSMIALLFLLCFCLCDDTGIQNTDYLVLVGEDSTVVDKIENTNLLIIDGEYFTQKDLEKLRSRNVKEIYTYFNIGSIETFRDYYNEYSKYALGDYENWPEEKWMDVSKKKWKTFLKRRAQQLKEKGFDGFFIDNVDVYDMYRRDDIYEGIVEVLQYLRDADMKIIINGGDVFVKRYLKSAPKDQLFDGVNQEDVYTTYDFETKKCRINSVETRKYYEDYLDSVVANGYKAYILEYVSNQKTKDKVIAYAGKHHYGCYISDNIELKL